MGSLHITTFSDRPLPVWRTKTVMRRPTQFSLAAPNRSTKAVTFPTLSRAGTGREGQECRASGVVRQSASLVLLHVRISRGLPCRSEREAKNRRTQSAWLPSVREE